MEYLSAFLPLLLTRGGSHREAKESAEAKERYRKVCDQRDDAPGLSSLTAYPCSSTLRVRQNKLRRTFPVWPRSKLSERPPRRNARPKQKVCCHFSSHHFPPYLTVSISQSSRD